MSELRIRGVLAKDPLTTTIPNDGVAKVIQPESAQEWEVLRYELESFVCDGQYQQGLERILSAFLANFPQPQQKAVWVSGFYGSGKSHLVRVLEHLWRDREFPDGARARSLVTLPPDIRDYLVELSRLGRQEGGLWCAAGMLGSGSDDVRLSLLAILFKSAGLPEEYPAAKLVLWLKQIGCYDAVNAAVASRSKRLIAELRNMYVSPVLADSLLEVMPDLASSRPNVHALLREQYPNVSDISNSQLRNTIEEVLSLMSTSAGERPLTLLVFDELQQFIGGDPQRTLHVQNVVEACTAQFGSHLLFVGTGQVALRANTELAKLQDRFSIEVTLADVDVEKVVREVVLRKRPDGVASVSNLLNSFSGEIDRHLAGTNIGSQPKDLHDRVADYPILPVRRRLWERMLRSVDRAGTAGQLRTQLRIVHDTVREVAQKPLGIVAPTDAIYWQIETAMQQSAILLRDMATRIKKLDDGTEDGRLRSRLCALIFMISKLEKDEGPLATGVRATSDVLADLLVDDLSTGTAPLRQKVPAVLEALVNDATLILVNGEYRLQTAESIEWETDYRGRLTKILADDVRMANERKEVMKEGLDTTLKNLTFRQGKTNTKRRYERRLGSEQPPFDESSIPLWVQDEWSTSQGSVLAEARQAGEDSPTVFVFLPRLDADELRQAIGQLRAAEETVNTRPVPQTSTGIEAKGAMQSRINGEGQRVSDLVQNIIRNASVYQGGGNEVHSGSFAKSVEKAVNTALFRLFPSFSVGDQTGWNRVVRRALDGDPNPILALDYASDVDNHPACKEIRNFVGGAGKKGSDVRRHFSGPPHGWPQDTIDGALLALLAGGFLKAKHNGQSVTVETMTQQQVARTEFLIEGVTVSAVQRIRVRKVASEMGLHTNSGEEASAIPEMLERLQTAAQYAGGEAPLPQPPDTAIVRQLLGLDGNAQIVAVAEQADKLRARYREWSAAGVAVGERLPVWERLEIFLYHARTLPVASKLNPQLEAIRAQRNLLINPNPIPPLLNRVTAALRKAVSDAYDRVSEEREDGLAELEAWDGWLKLSPQDRAWILKSNDLGPIPEPDLGSEQGLINSLGETPLERWEERRLALKTRKSRAREEAVLLLAPKAVSFRPPSATLNSPEDVEEYIRSLRVELLAQVEERPVFIQ